MRANRTVLVLLSLTGCLVGEPPVEGDPNPTGEVNMPVGGQTLDYFTKLPIGELALETLGLAPERNTSSDRSGAYALEVPVGSRFFVRTAATANLRPTISDVDPTVRSDVFVVSRSDITRQHTTAGVEVAPDTTTVFVEMTSVDTATPPAAISRASLSIVEPASGRTIAATPLVVGPKGDVDPALETAPGGVARFVFLNVPVGQFALVVVCSACDPIAVSDYTLISSAGVTIMRVTSGGVLGPAPNSFAAIYPRFQHGANGGLGCANCHTAGGQTPAFDGPVAEVREALVAGGYADLTSPGRSRLLVRPLYEAPADHPNATFLSVSDPDYQSIRAWIAGGAK